MLLRVHRPHPGPSPQKTHTASLIPFQAVPVFPPTHPRAHVRIKGLWCMAQEPWPDNGRGKMGILPSGQAGVCSEQVCQPRARPDHRVEKVQGGVALPTPVLCIHRSHDCPLPEEAGRPSLGIQEKAPRDVEAQGLESQARPLLSQTPSPRWSLGSQSLTSPLCWGYNIRLTELGQN